MSEHPRNLLDEANAEIFRLTRELDEAREQVAEAPHCRYCKMRLIGVDKCPWCRIAELESRLAWHPIETAPKDGTAILAFRRDCGILLVRWDAPINFLTDNELRGLDEVEADTYDWFCADFVQGCRLENGETPTHWMPLPAAPNEAGK